MIIVFPLSSPIAGTTHMRLHEIYRWQEQICVALYLGTLSGQTFVPSPVLAMIRRVIEKTEREAFFDSIPCPVEHRGNFRVADLAAWLNAHGVVQP